MLALSFCVLAPRCVLLAVQPEPERPAAPLRAVTPMKSVRNEIVPAVAIKRERTGRTRRMERDLGVAAASANPGTPKEGF